MGPGVFAIVLTLALLVSVAASGAIDDLPTALAPRLLARSDAHQLLSASEGPMDARALQLLLHGADAELPDSLYLLALLRLYGRGVSPDAAAAVALFERAARAHHADAAFALGLLFGAGHGVARDDRQSAAWLSAATQRGHLDAQWMLALMYSDGRGVRKDPTRAAELLQAAVDAGSHSARVHLAMAHEYGHGVKQDFTEAARQYRLAREDGSGDSADPARADATYYLALLYAQGRGVPMSQTRAKELLLEAAAVGSAPAMLALARRVLDLGDGDVAQALGWLERAAAAGDPRASPTARVAADELRRVLRRVERQVALQEQELGVPLRVAMAQVVRSGEAA